MTHTSTSDGTVRDEHGYDTWLQQIQRRFALAITGGKEALFTTDVSDLDTVYLNALPPEHRQYYTCHACRNFLQTFGGLVIIDDQGRTISPFWYVEEPLPFYHTAVDAMAHMVRRASVTGIFLSSKSVWGKPITGPWHHFAVIPPASMTFKRMTQTAGQAIAGKREDFGMLARSLAEFTPSTVSQAVRLLTSEALYRSEKCLGVAEWLAGLHTQRAAAKDTRVRHNLLWKAVAMAPAGFCHVRSSMIGTLLEDIGAGMTFAEVKTRFDAKMHPLRYQRPQAAPTAGNIEQAEKLVEQLGIAASLRRRFARLDEVETVWRPTPPAPPPQGVGVFAHLRPKGQPEPTRLGIPPMTMTWKKFRATILPDAQRIEYFIPGGHSNFTALLTAVDPLALPILQWDREDRRNPVSLYVWHMGSAPSQWGLTGNSYCEVSAITFNPSMWHDEGHFQHQGRAVIFLLEGARETRFDGLALFPECLKAELHGVRSTIEAYSRAGTLEGAENGSACGIVLESSQSWQARVRVKTAMVMQEYLLDRWD